MIELNLNKTNADAELNGVWHKYTDTISFKVARMNNTNYVKQMVAMREQYGEQLRDGTLTDEQSNLILSEIKASTILIDWKGIEVNGDPSEYTHKVGTDFFSDKRYKDAHDFIIDRSEEAHNFYFKKKGESKKK